MSTRYLMITSDNMTLQQVSGTFSTSFEVVEGTLYTHWKGERSKGLPVQVGDFLHLSCGGGLPVVSPVQAPRRKADVLPWLLGFPKRLRTSSQTAFKELLEQQRQRNDWWNYQERRYAGDGYEFVRGNHPGCGGYEAVASYIDGAQKIDKTFVAKVLGGGGVNAAIVFPRAFAEKILMDRFEFTSDELAELTKENDALWFLGN